MEEFVSIECRAKDMPNAAFPNMIGLEEAALWFGPVFGMVDEQLSL